MHLVAPGDGLGQAPSASAWHSRAVRLAVVSSPDGSPSALVTDIQGYSIHDGPGIRTVVFLKGCSLECRWCSNPECISAHSEVGFFRNLCTSCGACDGACPNGALAYTPESLPNIDRSLCNGCGECVASCSYKALVLYGRRMTVDEVFDVVRRDGMFYEASGGGATVSGGEPLLQPAFVSALLGRCREAGIHTCVETSGCAPESAVRQVLPYADCWLYDLKLYDPARHFEHTGRTNEAILANAAIVAGSGADVLFRMPIIPGATDDSRNLEEIAGFVKRLAGTTTRVELMPFHRLGEGKYRSLDRPYPVSGVAPLSAEDLTGAREVFVGYGLGCTISN
jgi:pyruvate formate lyase activating enzyme